MRSIKIVRVIVRPISQPVRDKYQPVRDKYQLIRDEYTINILEATMTLRREGNLCRIGAGQKHFYRIWKYELSLIIEDVRDNFHLV